MYEYACEDFQSWNFTNFCNLLKMTNVMYSHVIKTITPSTWLHTCPVIKKGIYSVTNLTMNAREILKVYPQSHKYVWKTFGRGYSPKGKLLACLYTSGTMLAYTKRVRN